jgi:hypothetical protein
MIINASGVSTLTSYPFIGYDNVVTTTNIAASSTDANYPASNLANPALNLRWQGGSAANIVLQATLSARSVNYLAVAGHNFNSQNIAAYAVAYGYPDSYEKILLHFDVGLTDESGKVWTASGNAAVTTALSKFGRGCLALDGTGDWIDTPNHADFILGSGNFTIDMWIKAATNGVDLYFSGHCDAVGGASTNSAWYFLRSSATNVINFFVVQGTGAVGMSSTTALTIAKGWTHIAAVRNGSTMLLFVDGVAEGSASITGAVNTSTNAKVGIGSLGNFTSNPWNGWFDEFRFSVGIARWTANFTPPTSPYNVQVADAYMPRVAADKVLLHFDGPNNSTTFQDQAGTAWTSHGGAKIDNTEDAGFFDGVDDYIDALDSPAFTFGTTFTVECWFKVNDSGVLRALFGQGDSSGTASTRTVDIYRHSTLDVLVAELFSGSSGTNIVGTTRFTDKVNVGWHHVAVVRSGSNFKLFVDGILENTFTSAMSINDSTNKFSIGTLGEYTGAPWSGWIDEFHISSSALYTANFTPTPRATSTRVPPDDGPIVFRFPAITTARLQLVMEQGDAAPQVAVMYAGTLLEMERSIDIAVTHTPINMGRQSRVASGKAENGKFIGRIVLGEWNAGSIDFKWFTPTWYRANFDPFLAAAVESPFFIAWNPIEYPLEVGYVALTNDAKPEVDTVTKRVHVKLDFQGEAA